jgi:Uncharacterised nucleotidyltransferase
MPNNRQVSTRAARDLGPLLVSMCRRDAGERLTEAALQVLDDAKTRERFIDYATRHGVLGLALATLQRVRPRNGVTGAVFRECLHGCRRRAAVLELERDRILAVLRSAALDPIILKGAGLATTVYDEPAERNFGDIDLLLAQEEIDNAVMTLGRQGFHFHSPGAEAAESGYREHHFHIRVERPDGDMVELHWGLTRAIEPFHLDAAAFMAESVTVPGAGRLRVPRPEHALLHIVVEIVRDGFNRLTRVVDVDRIVAAAPAMDWGYLEAAANAARLLPALALSLAVSRDMLGTPVPDEVCRRIRPTAWVRFHLALLRPGASLLRQGGVTRPTRVGLLQLWLLSDRSRLVALSRLFLGKDADPLDWLWEIRASGASPFVAARPVRRLGNMAVYQLALYATGVARIPRSWSGVAGAAPE